jgi:transposase
MAQSSASAWFERQFELAPVRGHPNTWELNEGRRSTMPKTRPPYPPEFRRQIVDLVRAGRTAAELAREFEPSATTIRNWVVQAERDEGRRDDGPTTDEREELKLLRRELRKVKLEREILAKATAWFARETGSIPSGDSSS